MKGNLNGCLFVMLTGAIISGCVDVAKKNRELTHLNDARFAETRADAGPTGEISPSSGSPLLVDQAVTVVFDESMDPASLTLGGDLAEDHPAASWSSTRFRNDTVRLVPREGWRRGNNRTLSVGGVGLTGVPSQTVTASYSFFIGFIYVNVANGGIELGTKIRPYNTIQEGIDAASPGFGVLVTGGVYNADYASTGTPVADLAEDVSLFGGFNPNDWDVRDPSLYPSRIQDQSTFGLGCAIYGHTVTNNTVIDGFEISGGRSRVAIAICNEDNASPTIQRNTIFGGRPDQINAMSLISRGISNKNGSSPIIANNHIDGGRPNSLTANSVFSYGIHNTLGASPTVRQNYIHGGAPWVDRESAVGGIYARSYGIYNESTTPLPDIQYNTISGGIPYARNGTHRADASSIGLYSNGASLPVIHANTINGGAPVSVSSSSLEYAHAWSVGVLCEHTPIVNIERNDIEGGRPQSAGRNYGAKSYAYAIELISTREATVRRNDLHGGSPTCQSYGGHALGGATALLYSSSLSDTVFEPNIDISRNTLYGGDVETAAPDYANAFGDTYGVFLYGKNQSSASAIPAQTTMNIEVYNNVIKGGEAEASTSSTSYGILVRGDSSYTNDGTSSVTYNLSIRNNTIDGGQGHHRTYAYSSRPIAEAGCSTIISPQIENNIFYNWSCPSVSCVAINENQEVGNGTSINDPLTVRNNNILTSNVGCSCLPYLDEGSTPLSTIAAMEALTDMTAQNNVDVDPVFSQAQPNPWELTPFSPAVVREGGLNGANEGWGFITDKNGVSRTPLDSSPTGWSMGAYEFQ